jgi:hypothetical protein
MALPFATNSQMIGPAMGAAPQTDAKTAPYNPNATLPANYQEARNAFQQQLDAQSASNPLGRIGLPVTGNDQFGQQFGMAADADAFNQFYNQNYANTNAPVPMPQQPVPPTTRSGAENLINNPLAQTVPGSVPNFAAIPNLGVTAGSAPGGGGLTQGTALPNITTTQQQATATPTFYTDYLNQLAKQGASAAQNAQYVGPTALQSKAFEQANTNVGNYQNALTSAMNLAGQVGSSNLAQAVGDLGRYNIAQNLAPQATAGIVGSGQFGSRRGAGALGQVIAGADLAITQQQQEALQRDYANKLAASQQFGNLATQTQALGLGDVNALATVGEQQRTLAQNQQLFPMQQLTAQSALLRGQTIPTSTASSYTGPIPGAYNASPLSQIAGLGSLATGVSNLMPSINKGLESLTSSAKAGFNALVGGISGKPIAFQTELADGGMMNVASDGTKSIMFPDGRVENYDRAGKLISYTENSGDMGYAPGYNEQDLYNQEAANNAYQEDVYDAYQNYYNSYNPYEGYDMNQYEP